MRQLNNQPKKSRKQRNNFFQGAYFRETMPHITNGTAEKVKALSIILARLNSACPLSIRRQQSSNETALPQTRDTTISQTQKRNRNSGDVFGFKFIWQTANYSMKHRSANLSSTDLNMSQRRKRS
jgi:hypothetical protein